MATQTGIYSMSIVALETGTMHAKVGPIYTAILGEEAVHARYHTRTYCIIK